MRSFRDGAEIWIEPWRAAGVPGVKDLVVDRSAFDRIVQAGAFISVNTGAPQDANAIPVPKADADKAFDAATCIGCGACVAACKNASAMLFVGAKVSHFVHLPQGRVEREPRPQPGRRDGQGGLRQLHQPVRVRSRLPEGDPGELELGRPTVFAIHELPGGDFGPAERVGDSFLSLRHARAVAKLRHDQALWDSPYAGGYAIEHGDVVWQREQVEALEELLRELEARMVVARTV
jgi:ferredoxin